MLLRRYTETRSDVIQEDKAERVDFGSLTVSELKDEAKERGLKGYDGLKKAELVELLEGE